MCPSKVSVSDAAEGIVKAANNYLKLFEEEAVIDDDQYRNVQITVKRVSTVVSEGNTYYYLLDTDGNTRFRIPGRMFPRTVVVTISEIMMPSAIRQPRPRLAEVRPCAAEEAGVLPTGSCP